ncbi:MAG: hypothetical protein KBS77_07345 [Bacteroidales bacterium]|nr:hypothetical protein [Candidatus Colicola faecequi]
MATILDTTPLIGDITHLGDEMLAKIIQRHKTIPVYDGKPEYTTGQTSSTLRIIPTETGFTLYGWKYAGTYDEGRKPGKMPNPDAILAWAKAKNIQFKSESQARSWAFCVARKISREGTYRYKLSIGGQQTDIFATPIREMSEQLQSLVTKFYAQNISRQLLRTDPTNL